MAIIELVFPRLLKDPKLIEEATRIVLPTLIPKLRDGGALGGLRGFIESENEKDVTSDFREVLVLGWPAASNFYDFIESTGFAQFKTDLKHYASGPPDLKLFETNSSVEVLLEDLVLEILIIHPNDKTEQALNSFVEKLASDMARTNGIYTIHGVSLNLEEKEVLVVGGYGNRSELGAILDLRPRKDFLDALRRISNVTQLVADVQKVPL